MKNCILFITLVLLFISCLTERGRVQDSLVSIMQSKILMPRVAERIYNDENVIQDCRMNGAAKLLVFVDSLQCGTCQISKFYRFIDIIKDGEPLMVGDPTGSEKMLRLFKDAINYDDD